MTEFLDEEAVITDQMRELERSLYLTESGNKLERLCSDIVASIMFELALESTRRMLTSLNGSADDDLKQIRLMNELVRSIAK